MQQDGVLLQAIPYLEHRRIFKIFTSHDGLISAITPRTSKRDLAHASPFCRCEWVYSKTKGELCRIEDATLIDPMLELRTDYQTLSMAGSIASDLLRTQWPHCSASNLYELLVKSFKHVAKNPEAVGQCFRLKILQFEGLLHLQKSCKRCDQIATHLTRGEVLCTAHAAQEHPFALFFDEQEWELLFTLAQERKFSALYSLEISPPFIEKIEQLFLSLT